MTKRSALKLLAVGIALSTLVSCIGPWGGGDSGVPLGLWTWVSGSATVNLNGTYGTKGVPAAGNVPGARNGHLTWIDGSGDMFLFGGYGYAASAGSGFLNDLWKYDGTNWTWVAGDDVVAQLGIYGVKGTANAANKPGARHWGVSWTDSSGNLWLFGGSGLGTSSTVGELNDLWKYDGSAWTWVSGSDSTGQTGVYGTKDFPAPGNVPGARYYASSWIDSSDNLWLFGGWGYSASNYGFLNDLWKFDGTNWTWVSGYTSPDHNGMYGTKGVSHPSNFPGSRIGSSFATDGVGNLWLFGGYGWDGVTLAVTGSLNDLWKFNGSSWAWVSGSNLIDQVGVYGTMGTPASANVPGGRCYGLSWMDSSGDLWVFGGYTVSVAGTLWNDLWKFDGTEWTWASGGKTTALAGDYGSLGTSTVTNRPGSREFFSGWIDASDHLWLFGGVGLDSGGTYGNLNDLWKFTH